MGDTGQQAVSTRMRAGLPGLQPVHDSDMHAAGTCCCCTGDIPLASGPSNSSLVCRAANIPVGRNLALGNAGQNPL